MIAIDRAAVLALLDAVIANPGPSPAAGGLALVLRMQVEQLPVLSVAPATMLDVLFGSRLAHIEIDALVNAITAGVAQFPEFPRITQG